MDHMNQEDPEEPTTILNMLNQFNRRVPAPQSFPFAFERVSSPLKTSKEQPGEVVKKRKVEVNEPPAEVNRSLDDSLLENQPPSSTWEVNKLRHDLIEARTEIKNLDYRFQELMNIKKSSDIFYEKDRSTFKYKEEKMTRMIRDFEKQLKMVRAREASLEQELRDLKSTAPGAIAELEGEQHALQVQKTILNARVAELEEDLRKERSRFKMAESEWKGNLASLEDEKQMLESQLSQARLDLKDRTQALQKLDMYKTKLMVAQQKVQELELEADNNRETVKQVESLQGKLMHYSNVLKENEALAKQVTNLRELISNNLLLEGQLEELKMQQKKSQDNERELIELKTSYAGLQHDLKQWTDLARHYFPNTEVSHERLLIVEMRDLIEKCHRDIVDLNYQKKEVQQELHSAREKSTDLARQLDIAHAKEMKSKNLLEAHASSIRRLKKQNNLVTWERNDLRQMLDSFQKEVTLVANATFSDTAPAPNSDKAKIEVLEKVIDGYRQRMEHLEADQALVCITPEQMGSSHADVKKLTEERDKLLREKEEWERRETELKDKMEHLNYQMEWRALKGDFDVRETKVLKLRLGPHDHESTPTTPTLESMKEENEKLQEKIRILREKLAKGEAETSRIQDVTVMAENNVKTAAARQIEDLKDTIKSMEIKAKRLQEVYKSASQEFRETVYLLFGYKVDRTQSMYKLGSMYADSADEYLLFQSTEGQLNLLETDYSKMLKPLLDVHLGRHRSIPMLLSSLTQELFQRQTMSMTNSTLANSTLCAE